MRGKEIFMEKANEIIRLSEDEYSVHSQSHEEIYQVIRTERGWRCSCPDHVFRDEVQAHLEH
ncbi:MAG: hypothetical protein JRN67_09450 [Nitrososphaerota archaeon]|nr:hypothetical protein [Nitrososphaerota archaeon]